MLMTVIGSLCLSGSIFFEIVTKLCEGKKVEGFYKDHKIFLPIKTI